MNYLQPFNGADPAPIVNALQRDCSTDQIVSVMFRAVVSPAWTRDEREMWLRIKEIIGCQPVYDAFGISTLPIDPPATFNYSHALESIGTIGNFLLRGGIHSRFVESVDAGLALARAFLDTATHGVYNNFLAVEGYSCSRSWCPWFVGENVMDETMIIGYRHDWWILAVTGTD